MASLMTDYEQQYASLTAEITSAIGKISSAQNVDRKKFISDVERYIEEAQEILEQMDLEVRDIEPSLRPRVKNRVDSYRAELVRLKQEFKNACSTSYQEGLYGQEELFSSGYSINEEQKQKLLDNSERLERSGRHLTSGYRMALESEQIGAQILQELHSQRETIQKSRSRLRETDAELGRSSRVLSGMMMRSLQQRLVITGVGIVFVIVIVLGIYFTVTKSN